MKLLTIGYQSIIVRDEEVSFLAEALNHSTDERGEEVSFSFKKAPNIKEEKYKEGVRNGVEKDLVKERDQLREWWLASDKKVRELTEALKGQKNELD